MADGLDGPERERFDPSTVWRLFVRRLWRGGERPEWHHEAACRDKPEMFFTETKQGLDWTRKVERARAVCRGCPVMVECLRDAIGRETSSATDVSVVAGVIGGMTAGERKALYRRMKGAVGESGSRRRRKPRYG
ncbi:WhiB family transcriptional regulator [Saccharopolyspora sp. NPDC050642]|uniref:WhiB family transcriptional regulator n=1 Tax=Saccharopolyspora sp. NPDC050642 TaxID=3157099 RepID=UPI0034013F06